MKVILLNSIKKLGLAGDEVVVRSGYARNFLIPQSKAILSTKENIECFKKKKLMFENQFLKKKLEAESCAEMISKLGSITITAKSSIQGKLFGSIGPKDIAKVISELVGVKIYKSQIRLPDRNPLKFIGNYNINIHIYNKISVTLEVKIINLPLCKKDNNEYDDKK
ncbi:50S ribosomal protein L9 [Candidatus Blochmanniella vafra str. BVAF]|uniref:Large ribosomal subunit protein bL9 n=1 Tax=Blochmanniella vafra (strain BVAF) TaxID=859654 RepID=E8Q6Q5_BLOVB|nr:50S ribosomal protein L9 [Candidatus Blochmannia vafer]ADV33496.1 50S ribosomal protein L9 [Candidatus Blochmannia vafer str. BVAF]